MSPAENLVDPKGERARPTNTSDPTTGTDPVHRRRISASNLFVAVITGAAVIWGAWWFYDRIHNVYILDARISSDMLLLSSRVPGWVVEIPVSEADQVERGGLLLRIDDRSASAHLRELESGVAVLDASIDAIRARIVLVGLRSDSSIDAASARYEAALSEQMAARGDLEIASAEWQRAGPLRERNLISQQEFEADRNAFRNAEQQARRYDAQVANAAAQLAEAKSGREEINVLNADLARLLNEREQALRKLEQAQAELDYHVISSPSKGVIDELFVDPGEYVAQGQRVLMMHDPSRIWVKANVKETDLRYIELGSEVRIVVDAYPDETHHGVVSRIGGAATSQFALMPNPNPSGNFTKSTQRVEIQIDLKESDPKLKPGLMVEVKIPRAA
ncbi:MAG: HlyD family secretion protein [Pseudomonadales bacterium]|nr:HlyD family secretion protein [Pseudomonadales bacterium]